jgi:hypothetical protein
MMFILFDAVFALFAAMLDLFLIFAELLGTSIIGIINIVRRTRHHHG